MDEHDIRIARLEQSAKDENWKADKLYNVKVSMTGKATGTFHLDRSLTDAQRKEKLQALVAWVKSDCGVELFD